MSDPDRPRWVAVMSILQLLTLVFVPLMISKLPSSMATLIIFYIPFTPLSAWLSWKVYPTRCEVSWILIILGWATFALFWLPLMEIRN